MSEIGGHVKLDGRYLLVGRRREKGKDTSYFVKCLMRVCTCVQIEFNMYAVSAKIYSHELTHHHNQKTQNQNTETVEYWPITTPHFKIPRG